MNRLAHRILNHFPLFSSYKQTSLQFIVLILSLYLHKFQKIFSFLHWLCFILFPFSRPLLSMDILGPFVNIIDTYLIAPLVRQINHLRNSRDNVNGLQTSLQNLTARKNDEQSTLRAADNAGQVETAAARNWLHAVREIEREADDIQEEYNQGTCARGWCVNCWSRYKVSRRSVNLKAKADLKLTEKFPVARQPSPEPVIEMEDEPTQNQPSIQRNLQQLIDRIYDPQSGIIGVYGMGGVGKTTLVEKVNNHFKENPFFDTVIMVTVSATPNIKEIRTRISKRLGLDLSKDTEDFAIEKMLNALRKKKFVLILDDVWQQLELKNVGIPHPIRSHKGSKIILTTRSQDVCTDMHADFTMKVKPLSREEAWTLFVENIGDQHVIVNDSIKDLAEKIVERCEGLPLAIVTVAHAMANRHGVGEWANAEREMKESIQDIRGMENKVLPLLKFSFDRLDNDLLKSLFLYCACFPEDHNITKDEIFIFCVGEGLVDKCGSLIAARNKGEALIGCLKVACMLEEGDDLYDEGGSVRMHDMMRELALWITSLMSDSTAKFLIRTDESIVEAPQATDWVGATRVSLMKTRIALPELGERCQKLTTLLLYRHKGVQTIPVTNFIQHMDHLSVLDLSYIHKLQSLPDSLSCLVNLRVLRLQECIHLRALPPLGMLQQLQVLDLSECESLEHQIFIPEWMGGVSKLRYLDVSGSGVSFQAGMISCLHRLEQLRMERAEEINWRVSSGGNNEGIDVRELYTLTQLTSLHIGFKDMAISDWFKPLVEKTVQLTLDHCTVMKDVIEALDKSQNPLKRLTISDKSQGLPYIPTCVEDLNIFSCDDMEVVLDGGVADRDCFTKLKLLSLVDLPKLERICVGPVPENCFSQLSSICIWYCHRLKTIFAKEMLGVFNNLKKIMVFGCDMMEVIIEAEEEGSNISREISFPKLKILDLGSLPALTDLCNNSILHCPRLQDLAVYNCSKLKKDPLHLRITDELHIIEE